MSNFMIRKKVRENYPHLVHQMDQAVEHEEFKTVKAWAEAFEEMELAIERDQGQHAKAMAARLKGSALTEEQVLDIEEEVASKRRCSPGKAESYRRHAQNKRTTDRKVPCTVYDPIDHIEQVFSAQGLEQVVTISMEDALVEALDSAKAASTTLEALLMSGKTWTKQRTKGRPKREPALV